MELSEIIEALKRLGGKNALIAIDGGSGSGKTRLAQRLSARLDCTVFHMDDFFLRPEQRTPERLAETGGNVDYERFKTDILDKIRLGSEFEYRPYDCKTLSLAPAVRVSPKKLCIVEGSYSLHPYFGDIWDMKIFVTASLDTRLSRLKARSPALYSRFKDEWIPKEDAYFRAFGIDSLPGIITYNSEYEVG